MAVAVPVLCELALSLACRLQVHEQLFSKTFSKKKQGYNQNLVLCVHLHAVFDNVFP